MKKLDPAKGWYSAQELAGVPGMPVDESNVRKSAKKNLWESRSKERGKGVEYAIRSLPEVTRNYILGLAIASPASVLAERPVASSSSAEGASFPAVTEPGNTVVVGGQTRRRQDDGSLTDTQRAGRDGALILCRAVEAAMAVADCSTKRACYELARRLVAGTADEELLKAATTAYTRPRKGKPPLGGLKALTQRLQRMMAFYEKGRLSGDVGIFLAPMRRPKTGHNPQHIAAFLRFYCLPTRPTIKEAYREMLPYLEARGIEAPSYSTVTRIENSLPVMVKYRGRVTGSEWRSLKPFVDRDVSIFYANDIWVGDGHSFKAKVQHPIHGQPFVPEITFIIDWVSRKIVGWSISLSESTVAVSDAFRHAQLSTRARPLVYYSDNGSGQTGKTIDHPVTGALARQGIAHETGIPGNPQGRGLIERIWQTTLIPLARTYPTCTWRGADQNYTTKVLKLLERKDRGDISIPSFAQLVDDVKHLVDIYNLEHGHRALHGKTPEEVYQERIDRNSIVFGPSNDEINTLWMPEVTRTPQRGTISLFNNTYFNPGLTSLIREGAEVRVRYDLHDASKVWLLAMDGTFIGEAVWNGNKKAAFPVAQIERLRMERMQRRAKNGQKIIAEAQAELGEIIDLSPAVTVPIEQPDYMPTPAAEPEETPEKMSHEDLVMWLYADRQEEAGTESTEQEKSEIGADAPLSAVAGR